VTPTRQKLAVEAKLDGAARLWVTFPC